MLIYLRSIIPLSMFFLLVFVSTFAVYGTTGKTLYVDDLGDGNYTRIQDAIDNASDEDTVHVYNGVYYENIRLYKPIKLIGENKETTIIDGMRKDNTIFVSHDNCVIQGFTFRNCSDGSFSNVLIQSNNVMVINNTILGGNGWGLYLYHSLNASIIKNSFINAGINIVGNLKNWNTHTIINNTVNGKELCYFKDLSNFTFSSTAGQIILVNCTNCTVKHVEISDVDEGIVLGFSSNNFIKNNYVNGSYFGIKLHEAEKNIVEDNIVERNKYGLYLTHSSENCIKENIIKENKFFGCWICCDSLNNIIYLNNFTLNNKSAYDVYSNYWYQNNVGNYWSDYNGSDANNDGVGDTPYDILPNGKNKDMYPVVCFDKIKMQAEGKDISGFEFLLVISAVSTIILWRKTRRI